MKLRTKKHPHNSLSNLLWTIRIIIRYAPKVLVSMIVLIPVNLAIRYLNIYLPAFVVSATVSSKNVQYTLFLLAAILFGILIANILKKTLTSIKASHSNVYCRTLVELITKKKMDIYYQTYENKDIRDLGFQADMSMRIGNKRHITVLIESGFGIIESVLGYILFSSVISLASPWLILLVTIGPILNIITLKSYQKWEAAHNKEARNLNIRLGYVEELPDDFSTAKDIRIYDLASWLRECFTDLSMQKSQWDKRTITNRVLSQSVNLITIFIRDGGAYLVLVYQFFNNKISIDEFVLLFAAVSSFAGWINQIVNQWHEIQSSSIKVNDIREFLSYKSDDLGTGNLDVTNINTQNCKITFKNVSFRYENAQENTLNNLSFTLNPKEKLALVGLNGSGKTTLAKLLCGLYKSSAGEIRINDIPLKELRSEDYYSLISPVFQDVHTAFFSIAETIAGKNVKEADVERILQCLEKVGLKEKVTSLPEGIYTKLGKKVNEDAIELSGGEAQKLMMARALFKDSPIFILDEPTAALDPIAESKLYNEYSKILEGKTVLFISHRLASTAFCDRIILLNRGRITECGSHAELIKSKGEYYKLFKIQSQWYK